MFLFFLFGAFSFYQALTFVVIPDDDPRDRNVNLKMWLSPKKFDSNSLHDGGEWDSGACFLSLLTSAT